MLNAVVEHVVPVPERSRRGTPCLSPHSTRTIISPTELSDDIHITDFRGGPLKFKATVQSLDAYATQFHDDI